MKRLSPPSTRQAGVGLVTAIFLLVVLAGLGVAMVGLFTAQQASSNLDVLGARAYQAARAGIEWGVWQRTHNIPCSAGDHVLAMPGGTTLSGFTVVVTCPAAASGALAPYTLVSTACNIRDSKGGCGPVPDPESVRRQLEVQL